MSIKADNPVEENKTHLAPCGATVKRCRQGLCPLQRPAEPFRREVKAQAEWEAEQAQVYSDLQI